MPDTRAVISLTKSQALSEHLENWCLHGQKACMFLEGTGGFGLLNAMRSSMKHLNAAWKGEWGLFL